MVQSLKKIYLFNLLLAGCTFWNFDLLNDKMYN